MGYKATSGPLTGARPECECVLCGAVVAAGAHQEGWFRATCGKVRSNG